MEVNNNQINYDNLLLELLNQNESINLYPYKKELELNIYMTLLSLSNYQKPNKYQKKINDKIENFLRKINNLKIKIQLKRKDNEIDNLLNEIIEIYQKNLFLISKYNEQNLDIEKTIKSKDAKEITILIDSLTKNKMNKEDLLEKYHNIIDRLYNMLPTSNYYLENDIIYFENRCQEEKIQIPLNEFKIIFDYLLDIDSYSQIFPKLSFHKLHIETISNIIKLLVSPNFTKEHIDKFIIPMTLINLSQKEISDIETIDTSHFNIENIKITDLYKLAAQVPDNNYQEPIKTAKWKNVSIPNDYLFEKLNQIITKGTYYFNEDKFILENLDNSTSDFKININTTEMYNFLKECLNNSQEKNTIKAR